MKEKLTLWGKQFEERCARYLRVCLPVEFFILAAAGIWMCLLGFYFPDIWWHICEGLFILDNGRLPTAPLQAFGMLNNPYPQEYMAYEVALAAIYKVGGLAALRVLFALIALLPFVIAIAVVRGKKELNVLTFCFLAAAVVCFFGRIQQRPELITNGLFVWLGWFLLDDRTRSRRWHFLVPFACLLIWANIHASFILGWVLVGAYWFGKWFLQRSSIQQKWQEAWPTAFLHGAGLFFGTVLTPHGPRRLLDPFLLQGAEWSAMTSTEMFPLPLSLYPFILGALSLVTVSFICGWIPRKHLWVLLFLLFAVAMSIKNIRYMNIVMCTVLIGCMAVDTREKKLPATWLFPIATFILTPVVIALFLGVFWSTQRSLHARPGKAIFGQKTLEQFEKMTPPDTPFLSDIRINSYANWKHPGLRPFIDTGFNRFEQDSIRYYHHMFYSPRGLREILKHLDVDFVLVGWWNNHWLFVMEQLPGWRLFLVAKDGEVYARTSAVGKGEPIIVEEPAKFTPLSTLESLEERLRTLSKIKMEKWAGNSLVHIHFVIDWLRSLPKKPRQTVLDELQEGEPENPFIIFLAHSLEKYELAEQQLLLAEKEFGGNPFNALMARVQLDAGRKDEARKWLFRGFDCHEPKHSAFFQQMRAQFKQTDRRFYWNDNMRDWIKQYSRKLNDRLILLR